MSYNSTILTLFNTTDAINSQVQNYLDGAGLDYQQEENVFFILTNSPDAYVALDNAVVAMNVNFVIYFIGVGGRSKYTIKVAPDDAANKIAQILD